MNVEPDELAQAIAEQLPCQCEPVQHHFTEGQSDLTIVDLLSRIRKADREQDAEAFDTLLAALVLRGKELNEAHRHEMALLGGIFWTRSVYAQRLRRRITLRLHADGRDRKVIAEALGISIKSVSDIIKTADYIDSRDQVLNRTFVAKRRSNVLRLHAEGKTASEIATAVQLSTKRVREIIREQTHPPRERFRYKPGRKPFSLQPEGRTGPPPLSEEEQRRASALVAFARTFPCLEDAEGLSPWEPGRFEMWCSTLEFERQEGWQQKQVTGRFITALWEPPNSLTLSRFNLMYALKTWDDTHRKLFLKWAIDPWWP